MKRIDAASIGLSMSDRLLVGGFVDLIALTDGHIFRLCDNADAPIVICNPANSAAAALLSHPKPGIAYIQYDTPEFICSRGKWCLNLPLRLAPLREIMISIIAQRREWQNSAVLAPLLSAAANSTALPVPAHRKLEHALRLLDSIVQSRIPHSFTGIKGVKILILPQQSAVYIHCEVGISAWQQALANATQRLSIFAREDARPESELAPISLAHFRWELARHLSAGMLLPGLASQVEFGLTRWPDFGTLGAGSAFDLRIVALIVNRPSSIAGILSNVPYTREGVIALLNSCALIGCMSDAPEDLLGNVAVQKRMPALLAARAVAAPNHAVLKMPIPAPQRGFLGMLGKLRAALSFVPRPKA